MPTLNLSQFIVHTGFGFKNRFVNGFGGHFSSDKAPFFKCPVADRYVSPF
jgi:hypothetical protein